MSVGFRLWWIFFVFDLGLLFHFIAFGLSPSGLGYDGFFFFDLGLLFTFYYLWFKSLGFRLWWIFFFLIWVFFLHFISFGFSPSSLGYDGSFLFFDLGIVFFHFIAFGLSPSSLGYDGSFLFFDLGLLLPFYCLWFKSFGFRIWCIFFVFWSGASSFILLPLV